MKMFLVIGGDMRFVVRAISAPIAVHKAQLACERMGFEHDRWTVAELDMQDDVALL